MYCPACCSQAKDEQKSCRACGFNLQPIIPLVGAHEQVPKVTEKVSRILKKLRCPPMISKGGLVKSDFATYEFTTAPIR